MYLLNFSIIIIIFISFYFNVEFSYLISLICSLAAATFIYSGVSLSNILFTIVIFNLTPLACRYLKKILEKPHYTLLGNKAVIKQEYEKMLKERALFRQSNQQLSIDVAKTEELYNVTKEMSATLSFAGLFTILGKKLLESFQFKKCLMILVDEDADSLSAKDSFEFEYGQSKAKIKDPDALDKQILKEGVQAQKITYIEEKATALAPLIIDGKFLGVLAAQELPFTAFDHFSILLNQFCLEFRRVKLYQRIQQLAITDDLTLLFVRRYFLERLSEELKRSKRHKLELSFLMIDIDRFKQCNDQFGHLIGDAVLREVAQRIRICVRQIDLVGRFGGEEFSVLLPDTNKESARYVAERIRSSVENYKFFAYDEELKVQVSIGVACFPQDTADLQQLIDKSDQALYRAKQAGRNRVCLA